MTDPHLATPAGKPHARASPVPFDGTPGDHNAITDDETMVGRDGNTAQTLPHDRLRELLTRYGRRADSDS